MRYIQKFFESKKSVEKFIQEKGMEAAVAKYGINKLIMYKLLFQYKDTELFYDNSISVITRVYNKEGKCLGNVTQLMSPCYKKLGRYFGPCENGNIILVKKECKNDAKTYGVFDKFGNKIVGYCKYFDFCFIPNGVALLGKDAKTNITTVHFDGTVKTQPFTYIQENTEDKSYDFKVKLLEDDELKTYFISSSTLKDLISSETEIGLTEKGIE